MFCMFCFILFLQMTFPPRGYIVDGIIGDCDFCVDDAGGLWWKCHVKKELFFVMNVCDVEC